MTEVWPRYDQWNRAIAQLVFGPELAGTPVYLNLEPDSFKRLANDLGFLRDENPEEELKLVVSNTLSVPGSPHGVFGAHVQRSREWEWKNADEPPPCIAILAVLSLVAESMRSTAKFAGSNYYGRLLEALNFDQEHKKAVERDFRQQTPLLWDTLNQWLEDSNGRKGVPTATAFDRRRYIGLPLSQALVRAQDRIKLPGLFAQCGMQPGQRISVRAMRELLEEWLPSSPVTRSLKRLWGRTANRERISEVVCAELEGWDGNTPSDARQTGNSERDNLFLAAQWRTFPPPEIELIVVARRLSRELDRSPVLSLPKNTGVHSASRRFTTEMRLKPIPGSEWSILDSVEENSVSAFLISNLALKDVVADRAYSRRARSLVLLKFSESENLYIEARRAELLETYIILAIQRLAVKVRSILQQTARDGFREFTHNTLLGVPPGWTVFSDVQLERTPSISSDDLRPLQPIARTHMALGNGLRLPGMHVWHAARLPEIRVATGMYDETNVASVDLVPLRFLDQSEPNVIPLAKIAGSGSHRNCPRLQQD